MALTLAERKKRYIEKQKLLNYDEYKLKQKLKNKKYYASKIKHIETDNNKENKDTEEIEKEEFILLEPLKKRINPINKSKLNINTIQLYVKTMKKIYLSYHKRELNDDTDLTNILYNKPYNLDNINSQFGFIKNELYELVKNNNKNDLRVLYSVITRIKTFATPVKQLYPYINKFQNIYSENRSNKVIDDTIQKKIDALSFDKNDIINNYNKYNEQLSSNEKLIYVLLTMFPTRRAVDYRKMKISFNEPSHMSNKIKYQDRYNYYYNNMFYFYVTKNKKNQKFKLSDELNNIIQTLIKDKKQDDFLISIDNKQLTQNQLSTLIMNTMYKIYGYAISAVEIRRFYATYIKSLVNQKILTEKEHRDISDMMNHNYDENLLYAY